MTDGSQVGTYKRMVEALEDAEKTIELIDAELGQAMDLLVKIHQNGVQRGEWMVIDKAVWPELEAYIDVHGLK